MKSVIRRIGEVKHVPQARTHDQNIRVSPITLETVKQMGQIGNVRSPNEIQSEPNRVKNDLIIGVAFEQIGFDRWDAVRILAQDQLKQSESDVSSLGVAGDDDPRAVEQIGGVRRRESPEVTRHNISRGGPPPRPI